MKIKKDDSFRKLSIFERRYADLCVRAENYSPQIPVLTLQDASSMTISTYIMCIRAIVCGAASLALLMRHRFISTESLSEK